jgi:hypothetical protein
MSGKGTLKNFKAMLAEAKLPERTVEICLRGDLVAEHEELNRQLEFLEQRGRRQPWPATAAPSWPSRSAALEAEMRDNTYPIRLRALSEAGLPGVQGQVPAAYGRRGQGTTSTHRVFDFNTDTGFEPLVRLQHRRP